MRKRLSETFGEQESMELHDLAARRRAHYLYSLERLRGVVAEPGVEKVLARIMRRFARWEVEASREIAAFRQALGRSPTGSIGGGGDG